MLLLTSQRQLCSETNTTIHYSKTLAGQQQHIITGHAPNGHKAMPSPVYSINLSQHPRCRSQTLCGICSQDSEHRRPYEGLLLAHSRGATYSPEWMQLLPPDKLVLAAVPGEHSRKPHLGRLLRRYVPPTARCLEVSSPADCYIGCTLLCYVALLQSVCIANRGASTEVGSRILD